MKITIDSITSFSISYIGMQINNILRQNINLSRDYFFINRFYFFGLSNNNYNFEYEGCI